VTACQQILEPGGIYIAVGGPGSRWAIALMARLARILLSSWLGHGKVAVFLARPDRDDLITLSEMMASGKLVPVIDRHYHLGEVPEASRHLRGKHARGKVIIDP
jgi:NADPH:quinone reductase-like Zn-dependent oxidoreductase